MENLHTLRIKQNGLLTSYLHNTYHANIDSFVLSWHAANCQFILIKVTLIGEIQSYDGGGGEAGGKTLYCFVIDTSITVTLSELPFLMASLAILLHASWKRAETGSSCTSSSPAKVSGWAITTFTMPYL